METVQARTAEPAAGIARAAGAVLAALAAAYPFDRVLAGMVGAGLGIEGLCAFLNLTRAALDTHIVRLGLATPHDRPLRRLGPRAWSVLDTTRLIFWRVLGVHPEVIGQRLDTLRSAHAVRAKARRLGLSAPARKMLHRPPPGSLHDPPPDFAYPAGRLSEPRPAAELCGRAAGEASIAAAVCPLVVPSAGSSATSVEPLAAALSAPPRDASLKQPPAEPAAVPPLASQTPELRRRRARRLARPEGQRELPLLGVVAGAETRKDPAITRRELGKSTLSPMPAEPALSLAAPVRALPVPTAVEQVDLSGDLTWFARVRRPLLNRAAVWTLGMMVMGGLHWRAAARRLGISDAAYRTLRQRTAVPVDEDRSKTGSEFRECLAHITQERSGYILRQCIETRKWFWVHKSDRKTWLSPCVRKRDRLIEGRSNKITIITQAMLEAEARSSRPPPPFASARARVPAS